MKKLSSSMSGFEQEIAALFERPGYPPEIEKNVAAILDGVAARGDAALVEYAARFDHVELTPDQFRVTEAELAAAEAALPRESSKAADCPDWCKTHIF